MSDEETLYLTLFNLTVHVTNIWVFFSVTLPNSLMTVIKSRGFMNDFVSWV